MNLMGLPLLIAALGLGGCAAAPPRDRSPSVVLARTVPALQPVGLSHLVRTGSDIGQASLSLRIANAGSPMATATVGAGERERLARLQPSTTGRVLLRAAHGSRVARATAQSPRTPYRGSARTARPSAPPAGILPAPMGEPEVPCI
jgi:hypothetical protein